MTPAGNKRVFRVLIAAPAKSDRQIRILEEAGHQVFCVPEPLAENLARELPEADAVCLGILPVAAPLLEQAPRLRIIARQGSGTDMVDTETADRLGIWVTNTPMANAQAVAEFALGAMIAGGRALVKGHQRVQAGGWREPSLFGPEFAGRTAALLGLGNIGQRVARMCAGIGMRVIGYDPYQPEDLFGRLGVIRAGSPAGLAAEADVLLLHAKLTASTEGILSSSVLRRIKKGAILINVARAELVDDDALLGGLNSGRISCAVLDVFREEPPMDRRLADHPSVIATPHIAAWSFEARERMTIGAAEEVVRVLAGQPPRHPVNHPEKPRGSHQKGGET